MLIFTRENGDEIVINSDIVLKVISISGKKVKLGISAPKNISILRGEIYNIITKSSFNLMKKLNKKFSPLISGKMINIFLKVREKINKNLYNKKRKEGLSKNYKDIFQKLFDENPVAIFITNYEDGKIIDINNKTCNLIGFRKDKLIGKTTLELNILKDKESRLKMLNALNQKGNLKNFELRIFSSFGTPLDTLASMEIIEQDGSKFILGMLVDVTHIKKAEEQFHLQVKMLNSIGQAVIATDSKDNVIYWNQAAEKLYQWAASEAIGKNIISIITADKSLPASEEIMKILKMGEEWSGELKLKKKDGSTFPALITTTPIYNSLNDLAFIIGISQDITDRKESEKSLHNAKEFAEHLIDTANVLFLQLDFSGKILRVNKAAEEITGYNRSEIEGKEWELLVPKDRFPRVWEEFERITTKGEIAKIFENHIITKSGEEKYILWKNNVLWDGDKVSSTISFGIDITEREKAEKKLKILSRAIEQSPISVLITDLHGSIEYVNPKFIELTGYSFEEIDGKNPRILQSGGTPQNVYNNLWNTLLERKEWKGVFQNKRKDRSIFWESAVISPILDRNGNITHYVAVLEDITDAKNYETNLINAKEKAEEANRLKSSFLANMSHELRTPLTGILGFSEILMDEISNLAHKELVYSILASGERLLYTLNSILDLSRIEANKYELTISSVNLGKIIEEAVNLFKPSALLKNIYLNFIPSISDVFFYSDKRVLNNILSNLLNNAIKFTHQGGITVSLTANNEFAQITVKDTGIGISESNQKIIFDEFRQVSEGFSRSFEGSGLGLTLVNKFINFINGSISVSSTIGLGSEFTIKLPLAVFNKSNLNKFDSPVAYSPVLEVADNSAKKILIVENDHSNCKVLTYMLKPLYSIDFAQNGEYAVKLAFQNNYNLFLMDINLGGGIDGLVVTKIIKRMIKYVQTPIIAITAYAMNGDMEKFIEAGCIDYISKPFTKETLLNKISLLISK